MKEEMDEVKWSDISIMDDGIQREINKYLKEQINKRTTCFIQFNPNYHPVNASDKYVNL